MALEERERHTLDEDLSQYRWTVDTEKDLLAVRELVSLCGKEPFSWKQILEVAKENPWIGEINQDVLHKSVSDEENKQFFIFPKFSAQLP